MKNLSRNKTIYNHVKRAENCIMNSIMSALDLEEDFYESKYKLMKNYLKYKYRIQIQYKTIYCDNIIAKYLEKNLPKICPINYQIHIEKEKSRI